MKYCKQLLSILLSLVLCGSMIAPAFAATFDDLNDAISDMAGTEENPQGYAQHDDGSYGIHAWTEGTGESSIRHVQVNEDVTYEETDRSNSILIGTGAHVDLTMADEVVITGSKDASVISISSGTDADPDQEPSAAPDVTITGGTISGGGGTEDYQGTTQGGGIYVGANAHLTLDGTKVEDNEATQGGGIYAAPGAEIELTKGAEVSGNEGGDVYLDYGGTGYLDGNGSEIIDGASINTPSSGSWIDDNSGKSYTGTVESKGNGLSLTWTPSTSGSDSGKFDDPSNEVEIDDPDVPLAEGPITSAEFIYKLWLLDGEPAPLDDRGLPAAVSEDHEYAEAIAWAVSADVVSAETFDPEELLSVDLARGFLTSFAAYADMVMPELTTLTGKDDELVMNSDDVLDEFFGEKDGE